MKILITGISGFLGSSLIKKLSNHDLIGVDEQEPTKDFPSNVIFYKKSILDPSLNEIFNTHTINVCIHLAWTVTPVHKNKLQKAFEIDYNGTKTILDYCKTNNVKHFIFMSSTLAYGALKDNAKSLTENNPLKAKKNFHYAYHKKLVETELIQPFIKENPNMLVTVLRPAGFLSPDINNYVSKILRAKILPVMIGGRHTRIQFLHMQDLLDVIVEIINKQIQGTFNVTPNDYIIMKNLPAYLPGFKIYVPEILARFGIKIAWFFHLYSAPSSYLDFVRYEFIASNEKLKKELVWKPKFSTIEAISSIIAKK